MTVRPELAVKVARFCGTCGHKFVVWMVTRDMETPYRCIECQRRGF